MFMAQESPGPIYYKCGVFEDIFLTQELFSILKYNNWPLLLILYAVNRTFFHTNNCLQHDRLFPYLSYQNRKLCLRFDQSNHSYLGGFEGVVCWKMNRQEENTSLIWTVTLMEKKKEKKKERKKKRKKKRGGGHLHISEDTQLLIIKSNFNLYYKYILSTREHYSNAKFQHRAAINLTRATTVS